MEPLRPSRSHTADAITATIAATTGPVTEATEIAATEIAATVTVTAAITIELAESEPEQDVASTDDTGGGDAKDLGAGAEEVMARFVALLEDDDAEAAEWARSNRSVLRGVMGDTDAKTAMALTEKFEFEEALGLVQKYV